MLQTNSDVLQENLTVTVSPPKTREKGLSDVDVLLRKVIEGNEAALDQLFSKTYNMLCHLALGVVQSRMLAEEVVTDVFAKLWNRKESLVITGSAKSYLMVAVRNQALDYVRKYKKEKYNTDLSTVSYLPSGNLDPCALTEFEELYEKVQQGIAQLPAQCQRIFKLSRIEGLKYKEIAEELDLSVKTIETQMGRALKFLRSHVYGQ